MADETAAVSAPAPATSDTDTTLSLPTADTAPAKPAVEVSAPAPEAAAVEAPKAVPTNAPAAEIKATAVELSAAPPAKTGPAPSTAAASARRNRYALLAATVAIAAGLGVAGGAWGAYKFSHSSFMTAKVAAPAAATEKTTALQNTVARMQTELAALRTSIDAGNRTTNSQFAKITERFDRVDRSQTERSAKFAKAVETLEKLEKRADTTTARDTTGSVSAAPAPAAAPQAQPVSASPASPPAQQHQAPQAQPPQAPIIDGWVVRNVYRGTAIVQSRRFGTMDVEPGDTLPEIGRIQTIKKQDGRWVVVTTRGLIVSMR